MSDPLPESPIQAAAPDGAEGAGIARHGLFLALLAMVSLLLLSSLKSVQYASAADEGYYYSYAQRLSQSGPAGMPELFQAYLGDQRHWQFPGPLRLAYYSVCAALFWLFGPSYSMLSYVSLLSHLLTSLITYLFSVRFFGSRAGLMIGLLALFSPLGLGLSRRALNDSFAVLCATLAVWTFLAWCEDQSSRRRQAAFVSIFGLAILAKETAVLLMAPFFAFALIVRRLGAGPKTSMGRLALTLSLPPIGCGLFWLALAGGPQTLWQLAKILLMSPSTNQYAATFGGGPWYRYLLDFMLLSPLPTLAALLYLGSQFKRLKTGPHNRCVLYFGLILSLLLFEYDFLTKNVRYLALLDLPIRVFCGLMIDHIFSSGNSRNRFAWGLLVVSLLCWLDFQSFQQIFISNHVYDPVSQALLEARGIIPP